MAAAEDGGWIFKDPRCRPVRRNRRTPREIVSRDEDSLTFRRYFESKGMLKPRRRRNPREINDSMDEDPRFAGMSLRRRIELVEIVDESSSSSDDEFIFIRRPIPEEKKITNIIPKETHGLSIINSRDSAKDLLSLLKPFLPSHGRILSVAVYPEDNEGYHAVAECDSSASAACLYYFFCDGVQIKSFSKKLALRFIPDSVEFKHPPRDIATEEPDPRFSALFSALELV